MNNATEEYVDEAIETVVEDMTSEIERVDGVLASHQNDLDVEIPNTYATKENFKSITESNPNLIPINIAT